MKKKNKSSELQLCAIHSQFNSSSSPGRYPREMARSRLRVLFTLLLTLRGPSWLLFFKASSFSLLLTLRGPSWLLFFQGQLLLIISWYPIAVFASTLVHLLKGPLLFLQLLTLWSPILDGIFHYSKKTFNFMVYHH